MSEKTSNNSEILSKWLVLNYRVTCFFSPLVQVEDFDSWWEYATENPPEQLVSQPRIKESRAEGPFGNGWLVARLQSGRVDWQYGIHRDVQIESEEIATLGSYLDTLDTFRKLLKRWIESDQYPPMQRLAFGVELLEPVADRKRGYEKLDIYLPSVTIDKENSTDFLYRINRRRLSSVKSDLEINRLSTWSVQMYRSAFFQMQVSDRPSSTIDHGDEIFHVRLVLDVNTGQEFGGEFDSDSSLRILDELISLSEEIAIRGDIP